MAAATGLALFGGEEGEARKWCPPCRKRKKGKCRKKLPDGEVRPGGTCQGGSCVAEAGLHVTPKPPVNTCVATACPDPSICKVRACADNVCAPGVRTEQHQLRRR